MEPIITEDTDIEDNEKSSINSTKDFVIDETIIDDNNNSDNGSNKNITNNDIKKINSNR